MLLPKINGNEMKVSNVMVFSPNHVLKNVQQEMLNLECAKNRPTKNGMSKNSSLASEVIGHIG